MCIPWALTHFSAGDSGRVRQPAEVAQTANLTLLAQDQLPLLLEDTALAGDAIERMMDTGFSQIPVKDCDGKIIGVFSWQSFGKRIADLKSTSIKPTEFRLRDAMEPANFIDPHVYIDTATDWSSLGYVLVGTPEEFRGILSITDVFGRLNDFGEAFVLLYEIEHEIRDLTVTI